MSARRVGGLLVALALVLLAQLALTTSPHLSELDDEELFNAGQAWLMLEGHTADVFRLQYRPFCGGCTLDATAAAGLFAALGRSWLVWKLVPAAWVALLMIAGMRRLDRELGAPAALAFALLLLLPPRSWALLSAIGWGNHLEAGVLALAALALTRRVRGQAGSLGLGALLGFAVWVSFSGAFAIVAVASWRVHQRRWRSLGWTLAGVPLGLLPWAAQWLQTGHHPFHTIYAAHESLPDPRRVPAKLASLLAPQQIAALLGYPTQWWGYVLGWGWAASVGAAIIHLARRGPELGRLALVFVACWLGIYCLVGFSVGTADWPQLAYPASLRYAAPLLILLFFTLAVAVGSLWQGGRRLAALGLLVAPTLSGAAIRADTMRATPAAYAALEPVAWPFFRAQMSFALPLETHHACRSTDVRCRQLHAYAIGREEATAILRAGEPLDGITRLPVDAWWAGLGAALASHLEPLHPGSRALLGAAADALTPLDDPDGMRVAMRAVGEWCMRRSDTWITALSRGDTPAAVAHIRAVLDTPAVADAGWWALGRARGFRVAGYVRPGPVELPAGALPAAYVSGFADALGEQWGPRESIPRPTGLLPEVEAEFLRGYRAGVARRWTVTQRTSPMLFIQR